MSDKSERQLAEAITGLTAELAEWRRCALANVATKGDVLEILRAVHAAKELSPEEVAVLSKLEGRINWLARRLKKLDAETS